MTDQNSILDKIIQSKQTKEAALFDPSEVISNLFKNISSKERDILSRRFGLSGKDKETLEQIGKYYEITRERIRQIETGTIKKLKELQSFRNELATAEHNVMRLLESHGGVMEENHLIERLLLYSDDTQPNRQASLFILTNLLNDRIEKIKSDKDLHPGWKLPTISTDIIKKALDELHDVIKQENQLLKTEQLLNLFKERDFFRDYHKHIVTAELKPEESDEYNLIDNALNSYLVISKRVDKNILDEWGLIKWNTISPKRMGDKVYLILKKCGKPLHFTEITDMINSIGFDKKTAYPATIHNELILDDRYVLVGRGIYALKEWGYEPGTVIDIITDILSKSDEPLSRDEIIKLVLDQRMVRKSTILLALTNKDKIKRLPDGRYTLNK